MNFELDIAPLDLKQTLGCGQTFRWKPLPDGAWRGPIENQLITLRSGGRRLLGEAVPGGRGAERLVLEHLRAGDDVRAIQKSLSRDPVLASGMRAMMGLRIVKMDEWECLVSFMLATYANIPRISKMIDTLSTRFGERIADDVSAFPSIDRLRRVSEDDLRLCGLGYRAAYVRTVCQTLDENDIARMKRLSSDRLRDGLKELPGVGDKVADCVMLFGFGRLEAFPIDVWMKRTLERLYGQNGSYEKLRRFAHDRFGPYAGYAQEYLYLNERGYASSGTCVFSKERQ